jgi:hypothetical protein
MLLKIVLTPIVFLLHVKKMELDGNTFLITNKQYDHANLAMWGTGGRDMGTYEQKIYPDQFW